MLGVGGVVVADTIDGFSSDYAFIQRVVDPIQGWLLPFTAARTMDLLAWQEANGVRGGLLEIGVFCGKYFSILLDSANRSDDPILGIDTFEFAPENQVLDLLSRNGANADRVQFVRSPSTEISPSDILSRLNVPARFISVDGSHAKVDVAHDMVLADAVLSEDGIIAADDFFNCLCMGVAEAIISHIGSSKTLVPFAYLPNKLLLCRPASAEKFINVLLDSNRLAPFDHIGETANATASEDMSKLFTVLNNSRVLVLS